jgi:hypothetical protein
MYVAKPGGPSLLTGRDTAESVVMPAAPGDMPGVPGSQARIAELSRRYDLRVELWSGWDEISVMPTKKIVRLFVGPESELLKEKITADYFHKPLGDKNDRPSRYQGHA